MSLEALVWASNLPMDAVGGTAFRVLLKLANNAHSDGTTAWRATEQLAAELKCSQRTVQRALSDLRATGLIRPGDQSYVSHIRPDRRPTVYDLNLAYGLDYTVPVPLHGVTNLSPHGVTNLSRGDNPGLNGVTTGVAQGTVIKPINSTTQASPVRAKTNCPAVRKTGHHDPLDSGYCSQCGEKAPQPESVNA